MPNKSKVLVPSTQVGVLAVAVLLFCVVVTAWATYTETGGIQPDSVQRRQNSAIRKIVDITDARFAFPSEHIPIFDESPRAKVEQSHPSSNACDASDYYQSPRSRIWWAYRLFPIARLLIGGIALSFPLCFLNYGSKLSRKLGEKWTVWVGGICIMGGMILLVSPLPWNLHAYLCDPNQHSEYRQTLEHHTLPLEVRL